MNLISKAIRQAEEGTHAPGAHLYLAEQAEPPRRGGGRQLRLSVLMCCFAVLAGGAAAVLLKGMPGAQPFAAKKTAAVLPSVAVAPFDGLSGHIAPQSAAGRSARAESAPAAGAALPAAPEFQAQAPDRDAEAGRLLPEEDEVPIEDVIEDLAAQRASAPEQGAPAQATPPEAPPRTITSIPAIVASAEPLINVGALNNAGLLYFERGQYAEARKFFEAVLNAQPGHEKALNNIGLSYYMEGALQQAVEYYEQALAQNSDNVETLDNLGNAYRKMGRFSRAERMFTGVLAKQPRHPETLYNYALLLRDTRQDSAARAYFEKFLAVAPEHLRAQADRVRRYLAGDAGKEQQQR